MTEISDRSIGSLVHRLAERARRESMPNPKTSAQVMARIRESSSGQDGDVRAKDKPDFRSALDAQLKKRG